MRGLSGTLLEAQRSMSHQPYIKVEVSNRIGGIIRLDWERLYQGTEGDYFHTATFAGDGSLNRFRVEPSNNELYRQRIENPGPDSDFSLWVFHDNFAAAIACCSHENEVHLFKIESTSPYRIARWESSDYGASWSNLINTGLLSDDSGRIAAAQKCNGDICLLYSRENVLYSVKREGGIWGEEQAWTNSVNSISGVSVFYEGDWNVAISGVDTSGRGGIWTCVFGDGYCQTPNVWSALAELTTASAGSDTEFHSPSLSLPDVFRCFFVEKYRGNLCYSRPMWCHSLGSAEFISNLWREPVPFDLTTDYGLQISYHGSYAWLCCPFGVWRAALSLSSVDVSQDVLSLTATCEPFNGEARIELRNDDSRYNEVSAIFEGAEVLISPGYRTGVGIEVSPGPAYWIAGWEYISQPGRATFIIHAEDGWGLLRHWRARRQFSWAKDERNVFQLLAFIFARAGLEFSALSYSDEIVNHYPAFTIHPGESGAAAVRHLLEMVPDVLFFRGRYGYIINPKSDDATTYSYGLEHSVIWGMYSHLSPEVDWVQVFGDGVIIEGFDWKRVAKVYDRLYQVHDLNLDTANKAQKRAEAELRRQEMAAIDDEILVPVNCGQELYDVVEVTDNRAGLFGERRRVMGMRLLYSAREGRYEQRLRLGGV